MFADGALRRRWLWILAVVARLAAAGALLFGPATDSVAELDGWDAARFQEIVDTPGRHWVDHEVEYPPGSVVVMEAIVRDNVVSTQRLLVLLSLFVDLGLAALLERLVAKDVGLAYLLLGQAMVPGGLVRLDLWATALGALGLIALCRKQTGSFAASTAVGAAVKVTPGLLLPIAIATRRWREAIAGVTMSAALGIGWLAYGGTGAIDQVLSLRGVTGWHLESVPGSLIALFSDETPRFEANAWRIGTINDSLVLGGRVLTVLAIVALGVAVWKRPPTLERMAAMLLGSTAALIVTAPLISPQFTLWLTPAAAMLWPTRNRQPLWITAAVMVLTGGTLGAFGPPDLGHPVAAVLLLIRDGLLVALVVSCWRFCLSSSDLGRAIDPLRADGASPGSAGS